MAFAQSRGITPELMAIGAERQHRLLERVGEDITATPELAGVEVQSIQAASRQTLALLISNIDEVLGAPVVERTTLSGGQKVPDRVEGKYLNTFKKIRGSRFCTFAFPDDNYLLNAAIARSVRGNWPYGNYILRNFNTGWHIDNIRPCSKQYPESDDLSLNFWRAITGETEVKFALPQTREDIDTLNHRFSARDARARVASALPSSDSLTTHPGQALLFPGITVVSTDADVLMAGVAHSFSTLSSPRYSSFLFTHFPHTTLLDTRSPLAAPKT